MPKTAFSLLGNFLWNCSMCQHLVAVTNCALTKALSEYLPYNPFHTTGHTENWLRTN